MFRIKASISTMVFIEILEYLLDLACPRDGKKFTLKLLQFQTLLYNLNYASLHIFTLTNGKWALEPNSTEQLKFSNVDEW